ncbi:MAG: zinc-ribbon domain-containing protein [Lactobacillus porci]|nr:zinc-ribbon domain-containing protein [Lactobacillus porci]
MKCPKCGSMNKAGAKFCKNCGSPLTQQKPKPVAQMTSSRAVPKKQNKLVLALALLVVLLAAFYGWGSFYYSKDKQIDRLVVKMTEPTKDLSKDVFTKTGSFQVTKDSVEPLQKYYHDHPSVANELASKWKSESGEQAGKDAVSLQKSGHWLLFLPRYKLQVATYKPTVVTNHADAKITVDGRSAGTVKTSGKQYVQRLAPVIAGTHAFVISSSVGTSSASVNVFSDAAIDLSIHTASFQVSAPDAPNGSIYINGEKVGTLDGDGNKTFINYLLTKNMSLYVKKTDGSRSETISDFGRIISRDPKKARSDDDEIVAVNGSWVLKPEWNDDDADADASSASSSEDSNDDRDEDADSNDDADSESDDADESNRIDQDDLQEAVDGAWGNGDDDAADYYVGGEGNSSYQSIKRMHDSWDNADNISSYGETVTISKAHKKGDNIVCDLRVTHHVVWTNKPTTNVVDQYVGTTLNDDYKIISMGHGSTISK